MKMEGINFGALAIRKNTATWSELKEIDWDSVPVTGNAEHEYYSRYVAGMIRDHAEFYSPTEREYALSVERWLTQYSLEHAHQSLRS